MSNNSIIKLEVTIWCDLPDNATPELHANVYRQWVYDQLTAATYDTYDVKVTQVVRGSDYPDSPAGIEQFRTIPEPNDPRFSQNFHGISRHDPCVICGKEVPRPTRWVHIVDGGGCILHVDDEKAYNDWEGDAGDMGWMPIGPDCYRQYKDTLKGYVHG